jgi:hypothetical protein
LILRQGGRGGCECCECGTNNNSLHIASLLSLSYFIGHMPSKAAPAKARQRRNRGIAFLSFDRPRKGRI